MSRPALVVVFALLLCGTPAVLASVGFANCSQVFIDGWVPWQPQGAAQICKDGVIAISYDAAMLDPAWSADYATPYEVANAQDGRLDFYADPDLAMLNVKQAPENASVWGYTWNRGHLCPAHIMSWRNDTKNATYTMANVSPQNAEFNQDGWADLEAAVEDWITKHNQPLHVVTGIMYKDRNRAVRTTDGIAIADYYFKVVCDTTSGESAGFYGLNEKGSAPKSTFHTVAAVEKIYGGPLFPDYACATSRVNRTHWWW